MCCSTATYSKNICVMLFLATTITTTIIAVNVPMPLPKKCPDVCPSYYNVVCALYNGCLRTFASTCVMRIYNCKYKADFKIIAQSACEAISNHDWQKMEL